MDTRNARLVRRHELYVRMHGSSRYIELGEIFDARVQFK